MESPTFDDPAAPIAAPDLPPSRAPLTPVGETPLVEVDGVWAKLECVNPCGSIKDRVGRYLIEESRRRGLLAPGQRIVEATSGNTGIALAYFGAQFGHPVTIVMPENMTEERKTILRAGYATFADQMTASAAAGLETSPESRG